MHLKIFSSLLFFGTIFLLPIILSTFVSGEDERYSNCGSFTCGKMRNISYPFWGNGQPEYCGYPGFKLDCQGENVTIEIMSINYLLIDISFENQTLKVARRDLLGEICPDTLLMNTTLNSSIFSYTTNDENATLLYNCWRSDHQNPGSNEFSCPGNNSSSYGYFVNSTDLVNELGGRCRIVVAVQVLGVYVKGVGNFSLANIVAVLSEGFEVMWIVDQLQCKDCVESGGRCGHNWSMNSFNCFCPNQEYARTCPIAPQPASVLHPAVPPYAETEPSISGNGNRRMKIIIGVVAGFVGILIGCIFFYICRRRNKKNYASPFISRNISSDPSSLTDKEKGDSYYGVHVFTYTELEEATNNFDPEKELGDGGFGTVYYGQLRDGRAVAVKRLYENNYKRVEQFMNEVEILTRLRHQHLVSLYGCTSRHSRELLLVYEYISNGTVADHLHGDLAKPGALPWPTRMNIAIETACALSYLHASEIIHRDVKTNNILLDKNFCVKVADFGLSRLFPINVTHVSTAPAGTPGYVDPEYHQCYQLTSKSDVYSFGVVLIELISSMPAVDITRHRHEINLSNMAINKIQNHELHELVDPGLEFESDDAVRRIITEVADLAFKCLQSEKEMRPSMAEVLEALKDIQNDGNNEQKAEAPEKDNTRDDAVLMKNDSLPSSDGIIWT